MDYRARYYSARLGRFVSADTVVPNPADPQAWNRYAYVLNNPTKYTDPSGYCIWDLCIFESIGLVELVVLAMGAYAYIVVAQDPESAGDAVIDLVEEVGGWVESYPSGGGELEPLSDAARYRSVTLDIPSYELEGYPLNPEGSDRTIFLPGHISQELSIEDTYHTLADPRSSREIRKSIRSLHRQVQKHQEKIDKRIGFDPVSENPEINRRAAEARLRHLQHEIDVFTRQIAELKQELINRGEKP